MYKNAILVLLGTMVFSLPVSATAGPKIEVQTISEKEIIEIVDGKETVKIIPATDIEPGQNLIFTLKYSNTGDEKATNVVINNPIPKDTTYQIGSAFGENSTIVFSIDSGQTFKDPSLLEYEIKGSNGKSTQKIASSEQYTDIRWIVQKISPGEQGKVGFKAKVK